jgi:hypothetical protein
MNSPISRDKMLERVCPERRTRMNAKTNLKAGLNPQPLPPRMEE